MCYYYEAPSLAISWYLSILRVSSGVVGSGPREPKTTRRMTKAEKARLDAMQSFGGCGFNDVLATSKKKIARNFEMKAEKEGGGEEGEVESAEKEEGREGEEKEVEGKLTEEKDNSVSTVET